MLSSEEMMKIIDEAKARIESDTSPLNVKLERIAVALEEIAISLEGIADAAVRDDGKSGPWLQVVTKEQK